MKSAKNAYRDLSGKHCKNSTQNEFLRKFKCITLNKKTNHERNRKKKISKFLSLILRHQPETIGLNWMKTAGQM
jgi:RNA:NAD 2'-phosphotransferase (TPT1/KptA family)